MSLDEKDAEQESDRPYRSWRAAFAQKIKSYALSKVTAPKAKEKETFITELWNKCVELGLPKLAVETKWIQGIRNGNLDPDNYGRYTVQDVGYVARATDNWQVAKTKAKLYDADIYKYCDDQVSSMIKYTAELSTAWHVQPDGVILGDALDQYMDYEEYIVENYPPSYFLVAMYACYYLWPWICQQIGEPAKTNLYYGMHHQFIILFLYEHVL